MAVTETTGYYFEKFGPTDEVLQFGSIKLPDVGPEDVQIEVKAVGLNAVDFYLLKGWFFPERVTFPAIAIWDVSGVVVAVGSNVSKHKVGDAVFGICQHFQWGSGAKHTVTHQNNVTKKPANLSHIEAGALPVAILTVFVALQRAGTKEGDKVLITAGSGGVGVHGIQLAKSYFKASEIATTASASKHELLKSLGATKIIDYRKEKFEEVLADYDVAVDATAEYEKCLKVVKPGTGKVVTITAFDAPPPAIVFRLLTVENKAAELEKFTKYLENGEIKVILDETSPWSFKDLRAALVHLETKSVTGKVVVSVE